MNFRKINFFENIQKITRDLLMMFLSVACGTPLLKTIPFSNCPTTRVRKQANATKNIIFTNLHCARDTDRTELFREPSVNPRARTMLPFFYNNAQCEKKERKQRERGVGTFCANWALPEKSREIFVSHTSFFLCGE